MPKDATIESALIIGAGPIVIGQACEFDYSGAQACKALREEGIRVILVNSNPATIMTDPGMADVTYVEPLRWQTLAKIIERERPSAILPTMGGQTALNCALDLAQRGVLEKFGVKLIGASEEAISMAEDRGKFKAAMEEIGLRCPTSRACSTFEEAKKEQKVVGFPTLIRPSFTMGGSGGGIAYNDEEFEAICKRGFAASPTHEVLIEESVLGWKEFEMEVVRDRADNCIIVCSIENFDPMGVHTGDSITVAPIQTLTDKEYQIMRDAACAVLRKIGVDTGGANVQFAVNPENGDMIVIEMNPRVSRSSALASKATGFPIAKIAAKLAVGYTLDELKNDITGGRTPASFEPSIDYVVVKAPRFAFEKFPGSDDRLTTQMKSVGEVMALGGTFQEAFQKALRGLETGLRGLDPQTKDLDKIRKEMASPGPDRALYVADAFRMGMGVEQVHEITKIDRWFLRQIEDLIQTERRLVDLKRRADEEFSRSGAEPAARPIPGCHGAGASARNCLTRTALKLIDAETMRAAKRKGFSDRALASLWNERQTCVRLRRWELGVRPVYKRVDTCAGEFPTDTAYMYSTYNGEQCEAEPTSRRKVAILGGGPNRIGQGIEFDYCCVHAAQALKEEGYETIMVNCNPETVSTDYDTSDRLYFEPVTVEDTLEILDLEQNRALSKAALADSAVDAADAAAVGVIVHYGGQTPLKISTPLAKAGVKIIGTTAESINEAEDRELFKRKLDELRLVQPRNGTAFAEAEAVRIAESIGYPLVVRPSYVLGGRAMQIVHTRQQLLTYMQEAVRVSEDSPVLLDRYLSHAIEVDVDCICDGTDAVICGIMQHIEQAGIHSGDSACCLPPYSLHSKKVKVASFEGGIETDREIPADEALMEQTKRMALALGVRGLMNVQFAIQDGVVYVLEVNPRASRTVPFVSKATGVSWAKVAAKVMAGKTLKELGWLREVVPDGFYAVKESVFPFVKFPGVDTILGPEMRSTGEVMGLGRTFAEAYLKSQLGAGETIPKQGTAFLSLRIEDRPEDQGDETDLVVLAKDLSRLGFSLCATKGTAEYLTRHGVAGVEPVKKLQEGRPHIGDAIKNGQVQLIINTLTPTPDAINDSHYIRHNALSQRIPLYTTLAGGKAVVDGIVGYLDAVAGKPQAQKEDFEGAMEFFPLQEAHSKLMRPEGA